MGKLKTMAMQSQSFEELASKDLPLYVRNWWQKVTAANSSTFSGQTNRRKTRKQNQKETGKQLEQMLNVCAHPCPFSYVLWEDRAGCRGDETAFYMHTTIPNVLEPCTSVFCTAHSYGSTADLSNSLHLELFKKKEIR